jgi:hypothetical protein
MNFVSYVNPFDAFFFFQIWWILWYVIDAEYEGAGVVMRGIGSRKLQTVM